MTFERFENIVKYNCEHQQEAVEKVRDLYSRIDMNFEQDLLNVMMVVRPLFRENNYLVMEIPMKDSEIGAVCYKGDTLGYIFLNSILPKGNVNFALCHEIYHTFYQKEQFRQKVELYMNEHYYEQEEEMSANLFAGILLMPEPSFRKMFRRFRAEQDEGDSELAMIAKLMSYFEVSYMAVLIRSYELGLFADGKVLEKLLAVNSSAIRSEFTRLWLNEDVLNATKKDDFPKLAYFVKEVGLEYQAEQILSAQTVDRALAYMKKIYDEIRG